MRRLLVPAVLMAIAATLLVSRFIRPVPSDSVDSSSPLDGAEASASPVEPASSLPAETVNTNETADNHSATRADVSAGDATTQGATRRPSVVTQADEMKGRADLMPTDDPPVQTKGSGLPVGQSVRAVDATGWVVSGTLVNVTEGWITIRTHAGREVFLSSTPALMFEVLAEDDANTFVSAPATSAIEPTSDPAQP